MKTFYYKRSYGYVCKFTKKYNKFSKKYNEYSGEMFARLPYKLENFILLSQIRIINTFKKIKNMLMTTEAISGSKKLNNIENLFIECDDNNIKTHSVELFNTIAKNVFILINNCKKITIDENSKIDNIYFNSLALINKFKNNLHTIPIKNIAINNTVKCMTFNNNNNLIDNCYCKRRHYEERQDDCLCDPDCVCELYDKCKCNDCKLHHNHNLPKEVIEKIENAYKDMIKMIMMIKSLEYFEFKSTCIYKKSVFNKVFCQDDYNDLSKKLKLFVIEDNEYLINLQKKTEN